MFFFFKQKTAYEMRISDWSSDVCSSDLRLGDDGVTRKQRRTDLADEDRQREVPRTDAREYATADELQFIALAGRPRQRQRREPRLCLFRVVTTEVDRLAYFGKRIGNADRKSVV